MSQNIHCSNKRPILKVCIQYLLLIFLTDHLTTINAQRAINNDETLTIQQNSPYHSNLDHHQTNDHNNNENNNDLDLYDEPLFFEESEFNEHHQNSPYKHVLNNLENLLKSLSSIQLDNGLTLIPTESRPEHNDNQNPQLIYLPAIISIHKRKLSENNTEICSNEINSPAIYDLEAILWTIDQINQLIAFKNGLMFNLAVLDSCSSPIILEKRLKNLLYNNRNNDKISLNTSSTHFNVNNLIGVVSSISSNEFTIAHNLLSKLNITLISAQDISFLPSKLGFQYHSLQTALPVHYFSFATLQYLKEQRKNNFSIIYSNDSLQSNTMLDSLIKWITSKDNQVLKDNYLKDKKKTIKQYPNNFCMQTIINVPSNLTTAESSKTLIQLQNEIKNNKNDENFVLILTDSHTTRELLIAYQHLINAGILNRLSFVLIKESNLNIVTGIEASMLNTLVIRESQKSLRDFVEYFEQLKVDNNLRNPFFKQYWQQSVNCGLNRDCFSYLFDQIDPINTINSIQSTFALANSIISIKKENCDKKSSLSFLASLTTTRTEQKQPVFCRLFNNSLSNKDELIEIEKSIKNLKVYLLDQLRSNELDLHQLSKHFNHAIKFTNRAFPNKMVDVLKFSVANQAYRFDRIGNYLNSGLIKNDDDNNDEFKDPTATSITNLLTVNHRLLMCNFNSPYYSSSLTRGSTNNIISQSRTLNNSLFISKVNNTWSQSWWRCWWSIASISSLIGALISVVCAIYFLFTFDYKVGSTILGYMILLGIFLLYVVNFLFLFPYNFVICWIRNYLMSLSYTIILSSMLVKVMNIWRLISYHNYNNLYIQHLNLVNGNLNNMQNFNNFNNNLNQNSNLFLSKKLNSLSTLMSMCLGLVSLESLTNLVWLAIYPPRPQQILIDGLQQWKCYNIQFAVLIETDSIFAVLFVVLLTCITMFFSALTWKNSSVNSYESRWIMFSCYVCLITWISWAILFKMFHLVELRDLFIVKVKFCIKFISQFVIANLLIATAILICMFIRKLVIFYKLNKAKKYNNKTHHLVSSSASISSAASYYGSVNGANSIEKSNQKRLTRQLNSKQNKKINEQLKKTAKQTARQQSKNRQSPTNQDQLDNVSTISAITTTSSIISSVKSYFTNNHKKQDEHHLENLEPEFNLSSITTVDQPQLTINSSGNRNNLQQELYPMDVYDASYDAGRHSNQNSNQPDSLFYTTKKSIFNSNHSLYLMEEEKDYI